MKERRGRRPILAEIGRYGLRWMNMWNNRHTQTSPSSGTGMSNRTWSYLSVEPGAIIRLDGYTNGAYILSNDAVGCCLDPGNVWLETHEATDYCCPTSDTHEMSDRIGSS